jgi:hypothetical protein
MSLFTFALQNWEIDDEYIRCGMPSIKLSPWDRVVIGKKKNVKSFAIFIFLQVTMCIDIVEITNSNLVWQTTIVL